MLSVSMAFKAEVGIGSGSVLESASASSASDTGVTGVTGS